MKSSPRPKVAIVGGPDVHARLELMRALRTDFDLVAIGTSPSIEAKFQAAGFPYRYVPMKRSASPLQDARYLAALFQAFRHERPCIVHTFDTKPSSLGRIAARAAKVPCVIGTLPGLGSLYSGAGVRNRLLRAFYEPLQRTACRLSDATIFQNPEDAAECIRRSIVAANRSLVIAGSGVATDVFRPEACSKDETFRLRKDLGIAEKDVVVLMIARVVRSKGVLEFAQLAKMAETTCPRAKFVLVGPEDEGSIDRLNRSELEFLRTNVQWLGARSDIRSLLASSDIFVLPSTYREGIPRVLLEAAAMELPLITYNLPGCSQAVCDGVNGFLIRPGDVLGVARAIQALAEDESVRIAFGRASRELAERRFSLSVIANETAALYRDVLMRREGTPALQSAPDAAN